MSIKLHLILIDIQNDFVNPNGSLYVKGGEENAKRTSAMIRRLTNKIDDIHVTMDSHHKVDISHPLFWVDTNGNHPSPFTLITPADVETGKWRRYMIGHRDRTTKYLKALDTKKRYPHVIWPEHCLIGDEGHNLFPEVAGAIHEWESKRFAMSDVVTKGSNPFTEHFSAVQAEVPDPSDPSTQLNRGLVDTLEQADLVLWAGEALSHCLANSFRDTVNAFSNPEHIKKMVLLKDASSSVTGFENLGDTFVKEMIAKGMRVSTTTDILA